LYFEAHDVLEHLWLAGRGGPNHAFFKGMIQLAGAFVHLQRNRLRPAAALLTLADANLRKYPVIHEQLDLGVALELIADWQHRLEAGAFAVNPLTPATAPILQLQLIP
jgi:predicted metal-dependent hydrolase